MSKINFSEEEKKRIKNTVKKVEDTTSGEIVTYFVKKSDNYYEASYIAASISGVVAIIFLNILSQLWLLPFEFNMLTYGLIIVAFMLFTFLSVQFVPFLKRAIISEKRETQMVLKRATEAFITEEVFNTKDRTGILIFISEFEHNVEVMADSGINSKVEQTAWNNVVQIIIDGIKNNKTTDGIVAAIEECGKLLVDSGFVNSLDNKNELTNEIRIN